MDFNLENVTYEVIIERKNNKNLYIRITNDLKIKVSCPFLYTKNMIKNILKENENSIKKMILHQKLKNKNNNKEKYCYLGKQLNIIFKDVKSPIFKNDTLIIKDENMLNKWYKKIAKETFKKYLDEAYYVFEEKIPYPILKVRNMKTRWGVCNKKDNSITLNLELIRKDQKYLNYVIVHELSHFVHFDHSKSFWKTVEKYCPEYKLVRKELKK